MVKEMMYSTPCAYSHLSDSEAIQAAVRRAAETDIRTVVIPDSKAWTLDKPVYLPNGITVILDGAQIRAEGIAFTNAHAGQAEKMCLGGEQESLFLLGTKGASVTGQNGPQVCFSNLKNYGITGISFVDGDGLRLLHCRYGKVQRLQFRGSRYGVFMGEGCNNNLLEDILAETKEEAVLWSAGGTSVWGRSTDLYDTSLCRLDAKTGGAPAVALYAGPVIANNLLIRDVTDRTDADGVSVCLGTGESAELLDLTVRGVATSRAAVSVSDRCDGVFLGNLGGAALIAPDATRVLEDSTQEEIEKPRFRLAEDMAFVDANDPRFAGATDWETLQNAINSAAGSRLLIPRFNARTGGTVWNIDKTLHVPSDTTLILLDAHLRLADFTYCHLFTNADRPAKNIRILGIGSAVVDSGRPNGLKVKNAGTLGYGPITDNALLLFAGVDGLAVQNLRMVQSRWYCILCVGCTNGHLADLDIFAPPIFPDLGGIRIHSGCHDILVENITGLTGEDTVVLSALAADDSLFCPENTHISNIHIRTVKANASRCCMVDIRSQDHRAIHHILVEQLLDCSLSEQKKLPDACVRVGGTHSENLSHIRIRDLFGRAAATVQMGGSSKSVSVSNIHSYGSSDSALRTVPLPESYDYPLTGAAADLADMDRSPRASIQNWYINGVFFRCQQASRYMRGTATSIITDQKKYMGTVVNLQNLQAENVRIEHILAERIGCGILVTGCAAVEVADFRAAEVGRETAVCGGNSCLTVDGETVPVTDTRQL